MTALYPSTSAAQVFVPLPVRLSTTGGSAPITPDYAPTGTLADLFLQIADSAGNSICAAALDALPAGITYSPGPAGGLLTLTTAKYNAAGQYVVGLGYTDPNYQPALTSFQWGGWIDTLLGSVANTEGLATSIDGLLTTTAATVDQTIAVLSASYDVDDPAAPTVQTLSVGGSPIATRTIANADGSPINPAQVLILGELTAVP